MSSHYPLTQLEGCAEPREKGAKFQRNIRGGRNLANESVPQNLVVCIVDVHHRLPLAVGLFFPNYDELPG